MDLPTVWFVVIAVLWTGFFVLEGFDFGVGMLHWFVGREDIERRVALNAIGPFWDGNEVWLIVGGAGIFAAFPGWYATMFSSLYLALLLILVALILRGTAFEYRGKRDSVRWRTGWSVALVVSSALIPLLLGVGVGDLLAGLPLDASGEFTGTFWSLLTPYGLATGVLLLAACLAHGARFLALKTTGAVRDRSHAVAGRLTAVTLVLAVLWIAATIVTAGRVPILAALLWVVSATGLGAALWFGRAGREGRAFAGSAVSIGAAVASLFATLYPNVVVSTTGDSLTVAGTASGDYALTVMTVVAAVLFPVVLLYQGWTYYVFRQRVSAPQ